MTAYVSFPAELLFSDVTVLPELCSEPLSVILLLLTGNGGQSYEKRLC